MQTNQTIFNDELITDSTTFKEKEEVFFLLISYDNKSVCCWNILQ